MDIEIDLLNKRGDDISNGLTKLYLAPEFGSQLTYIGDYFSNREFLNWYRHFRL